MRDFVDRIKRPLVGRPVPSEALGETLLPKRIAPSVFVSDALPSADYTPGEVLITLATMGAVTTSLPSWVTLAVVGVLAVVMASYRQTVHIYSSGGGNYEVVSTNLGSHAGLLVASTLLSGYVLTVAVPVSSGIFYLVAALPALVPYKAEIAVAVATVLAALNARGSRESGRALAIPTYLYMGVISIMVVVGLVQELTGVLGRAESANSDIVTHAGREQGLTGLVGGLLVLRAFSLGYAALTGVEAISNGVSSLQRPKSRNTATALLFLGMIAALMLMSVAHLAGVVGVRMMEDPAHQLLHNGALVGDSHHQDPAIGQVAATALSGSRLMFCLVAIVAGLILVLAANTTFNGFPVLTSVPTRDKFPPRQLSQRGDRLVFSNGIIALWLGAAVFLIGLEANTIRLIQLYIVDVFISFSLPQMGMVCHWTRELTIATEPRDRSRMCRARIINSISVLGIGTVLVIVLLTKLTRGVWITLAIVTLLYLVMNRIRRHYRRASEEVVTSDLHDTRVLPAHVHAIVPASRLHQPTLRALTYAQSTHPTVLGALTVDTSDGGAGRFLDAWEKADIAVPLTVLDSPYRDITRPAINYVRSVHRESPRDFIVVSLSGYIVRYWQEQILHNQTALRLKIVLLFTPGVVVVPVPWQLRLSGRRHIRHSVRAHTAEGTIDADVAMRRHVDSHLSHPDQHSPVDTGGVSAGPQEN